MHTHHDYHPLTVTDVVDETADTRSFAFAVPPALRDTFAYVAGQFCTFRATIDGDAIVRCYSMSSAPEVDAQLTVTAKRVPGGRMSNWMNDVLGPGSTIDVMPPAGLFVLHETDVPIIAFAGGSGITPVFSIIKSALATTERSISLVYANRDTSSIIFAEELARLESAMDQRLVVHHHLDVEDGFLDAAACESLVGERRDASFYICGPGPFMDVVESGLEIVGVDRAQVFVERFEAPGSSSTLAEASATESLVIRLGRRKHVVDYRLGDTILETARRAGLSPPFSCESGSCATCMAHVDEGSATMRANNALSADEVDEGWVLTCQAIPTSRTVVVDYDD